jgi:hypothetical protein
MKKFLQLSLVVPAVLVAFSTFSLAADEPDAQNDQAQLNQNVNKAVKRVADDKLANDTNAVAPSRGVTSERRGRQTRKGQTAEQVGEELWWGGWWHDDKSGKSGGASDDEGDDEGDDEEPEPSPTVP